MPTKDTSGLQRARVLVKKEDMPVRTMLRRVRVGKNEVDYIGDDVTVRYFTYRPAPQRRRVAESRIAYIGDDVTVRYFTPKLAVKAQQPVGP
jgi:3-deoxy-D-manno-octulosonate 8-phosphate phosphatase KdsC-like HAD superfamily phosphatase